MTARLFISPSRQLIFLALHYLVFTRQLVTLQTTPGDNSNAKSVSPLEGPKNMVNPDQVKAVIDGENSLTNKVLTNGMSTLDALQKGASSTVNNLGWFTTSLLSNIMKVLSNTMEAVKDVGSNTLNAGVRVGMNTASVAGGAVRSVLGYAKAGTHVVGGQLNNTSLYFKNISKNPDSVHLIPQTM
uniref:Uncharacterized protein n=2 Tax=Cacopsylla melanoneura TaxID=428564 RepID=A0A8D8M1M0_9HEMI